MDRMDELVNLRLAAESDRDRNKSAVHAIVWAIDEIDHLTEELARTKKLLAHLQLVCDTNRWPYEKE